MRVIAVVYQATATVTKAEKATGASTLRVAKTASTFTRWTAILTMLLVAALVVIGLASSTVVMAKSPFGLDVATTVSPAALPQQGREVLALIYLGGPLRYDKDGTVFGNRERQLPPRNRGYYREYTVKTPGERTRGARRIICGGIQPTAPDACYYTDDHYASFRKIVQ